MHNEKNISKFNKNQSAFYLAAKHYVNVKVLATNTTIPQGDRTLLKRPCSTRVIRQVGLTAGVLATQLYKHKDKGGREGICKMIIVAILTWGALIAIFL